MVIFQYNLYIFGIHLWTVIYPKPCYKEQCYKEVVAYIVKLYIQCLASCDHWFSPYSHILCPKSRTHANYTRTVKFIITLLLETDAKIVFAKQLFCIKQKYIDLIERWPVTVIYTFILNTTLLGPTFKPSFIGLVFLRKQCAKFFMCCLLEFFSTC